MRMMEHRQHGFNRFIRSVVIRLNFVNPYANLIFLKEHTLQITT